MSSKCKPVTDAIGKNVNKCLKKRSENSGQSTASN
jgi:hypothetical protein